MAVVVVSYFSERNPMTTCTYVLYYICDERVPPEASTVRPAPHRQGEIESCVFIFSCDDCGRQWGRGRGGFDATDYCRRSTHDRQLALTDYTRDACFFRRRTVLSVSLAAIRKSKESRSSSNPSDGDRTKRLLAYSCFFLISHSGLRLACLKHTLVSNVLQVVVITNPFPNL